MKGEAEAAAKKAAETRTLLAKLKNLGRTYKEKSEKLEAELKEAKEAKAKVDAELTAAKEKATAAAVDAATAAVAGTSSGEDAESIADLKSRLAVADEMVKESSERLEELEEELENAKSGDNAEEIQKLKVSDYFLMACNSHLNFFVFRSKTRPKRLPWTPLTTSPSAPSTCSR